MDVSAEKIKLMTNKANGVQKEINIRGQKLGTVQSSRTLQPISKMGLKSGGSLNDCTRTKLKQRWRDNKIYS